MSFLNLNSITFRRGGQRSQTKSESENHSDNNEADATKTSLDYTSTSMPAMSDDEDDQIKELKCKIEELSLQLNIAHEEIKNLNLENAELKLTITNISKDNEMLKKATDSLKNVQITPRKLKGNKEKGTPQKGKLKQDAIKVDKQTQKNEVKKNKKVDKQTQTDAEKNNQTKSKLPKKHGKRPVIKSSQEKKKNKLLLISTTKNQSILETAKVIWGEEYEFCHYIYPNTGIKVIFSDLQMKLKNLTKNDMCIMMIGEEDFKHTNNYFELVLHIRQATESIVHTNILVCMPTYKYSENTNVFNWRVESFNNLLYLDVLSNEHVYLMDPNVNLSYDHTMFLRYGQLNAVGINVILNDIALNIRKINELNKSDINNNIDLTEPNNNLFLAQ